MNTEFWYQYRDASNYKQSTTVVFAGEPTDFDAANQALLDAADAGQFFIAKQLGLEDLRERWDSHYEDDHYWHEFNDEPVPLELTDREPTDPRTAQQFVEQFLAAAAEGWAEHAAQADLDYWTAHTRVGR